MAIKIHRKRSARAFAKSDINVTPFIDILLVLLVIFMVITPITPTGLDTTIPDAPPPGPRTALETIVLSLDESGVVRINQQEVGPALLTARLQEIFKTRNDRTIFVQAADSVLFADVAQLIDTASGAGIHHVGLLTEQISN